MKIQNLNDQEFIEAFEKGTFPGHNFHHAEHIRLVWIYLQLYPLPEVMIKARDGIRQFAASMGKSDLYHETITFMFVFIIHHRITNQLAKDFHEEIQESNLDQIKMKWEDFHRENPDLFQWNPSVLGNYFPSEILNSPQAKDRFLWPPSFFRNS